MISLLELSESPLLFTVPRIPDHVKRLKRLDSAWIRPGFGFPQKCLIVCLFFGYDKEV